MRYILGMTNTETDWVTEPRQAELARLKGYFPYRIVYGALHPSTGEWRSGAVTTRREPNRLAREGWKVVTA